MSRDWIDYNNLHMTGEYNRAMVRLKEEELDIYRVAVLDLVGSLAEKGIIVSGVKDEE